VKKILDKIYINPLNTELNPICHLLALLGAHPILHISRIRVNQGVRQGCNLSPSLFNIYIDNLLRNWKHKADTGIKLKRNIYLNTLLFADDQVIIQDSEDKLQKSVYLFN